MCQLFEPLSKFTDALASETRVTLSAIKPVLDHITCEVLVENNNDPSLTKEMKRVMREDLNSRYTERAKNVMKMACFIDPRFKMSFLDEPEPAIVDRCVQETLKLTPAQTVEEPQSSSDPPVASEGKGLAGLLKRSPQLDRREVKRTKANHPRKWSERRDQDLPLSAVSSSRRGSTGVVEVPCI